MEPEKSMEERLKEVTVGERKPHNSMIYLAPYDSKWPDCFEQLKKGIFTALGSAVIRLEHVGSTSIIGLPAKPIIDMVLEVEDSRNEEAYVTQLEAIGYILRIREPKWFEHRLLKSPKITGNLHVFSRGCKEVERMITFRNWLNSHLEDRLLYLEKKQELSKRVWQYRQEYADAKSAVVNDILNRATNHKS